MAESVWRVRVVGALSGDDRFLSTYHFDGGAGGGPAEIAAVLDGYLSTLKAQQTTDIKARRDPVMQRVDVASGDIIAEASVTTQEFTGSKTQLREWTVKNGLISWKSATFIDGRRLIGRTFVYGVPADAGEQTPGSGYLAVLQDAADTLIENSQTQEIPLQCVRRPRLLEGGGALAPGASEDATSAQARSYWGVLKSRR